MAKNENKDFKPKAYTTIHLCSQICTSQEKGMVIEQTKSHIEEIKKRHNFIETFDLEDNITKLVNHAVTFKDIVRQLPKQSDVKNTLKNLDKHSTQLLGAARYVYNTCDNAPEETRTLLARCAPVHDEHAGHQLLLNTKADLSDVINNLERYLKPALQRAKSSMGTLYLKRANIKTDDITEYFIWELLDVFSKGTKQTPHCYRARGPEDDDEQGNYRGNFFEFLIDIMRNIDYEAWIRACAHSEADTLFAPVIHDLKFNKKDSTIGKNCTNIIAEKRKIMLGQIDSKYNELYHSLSDTFSRQCALGKGKQLGISQKQIDNFLGKYNGRLVIRVGRGKYNKIYSTAQ